MTTATAALIEPAAHLAWAAAVARGVARPFRVAARPADLDDLRQVAVLTLLRCAGTFDPRRVPPGGCPAGAFRGYAHPSIRADVARECRRLLNGGLYHRRREAGHDPLQVESLDWYNRDPDRRPFPLYAREPDPADLAGLTAAWSPTSWLNEVEP